jgi:hypothetical protein
MGQRDYGCPYNDRVHPEWRDLRSRALPVAPRAACGACSTPLTGAGTAPTTDRRQMRAFSARYGDGYLCGLVVNPTGRSRDCRPLCPEPS